MNNLPQYLSQFLNDYLPQQKKSSIHTSESYAYTFQMLIRYAAQRHSLAPSQLTICHLNITLIVDYLNYLERERHNSARTRNARCSAIKSFFKFLEYRDCRYIEQSRQIQNIPKKRITERLVQHLTTKEMRAILNSPDSSTIMGIRDRAMLSLCYSAGLRVSELINIQIEQLNLSCPATISIIGKGRKERILPIQKDTLKAIKAWIPLADHVIRSNMVT